MPPSKAMRQRQYKTLPVAFTSPELDAEPHADVADADLATQPADAGADLPGHHNHCSSRGH